MQPSHPLSPPSPLALNLSQHHGWWASGSSESALCLRWPKYWSFSFSLSPFNKYSGLISFKTDWFDLLAVQRTVKSFLHYHNLKASILQHSVFMVQLSHPYMTTGKSVKMLVTQSCPTLCDPIDCKPLRLVCLWDSPGKNTGVGCHFLLQGIFPSQGSNPGLLHCRQILYCVSHQGKILGPKIGKP